MLSGFVKQMKKRDDARVKITHKLLHRLSRVTLTGRYIPEIDGFRFLAIVPVVLFHVRNFLIVKSGAADTLLTESDWLARLTAHGHYGVQLFFVISGFVLALPFAAHFLQAAPPVKLRNYYLRRLTRLEPPYVLCLFICFGLFILIGKSSFGDLWPHLLAGVFYSHSLVYGTHNVLNLVMWSLEVEVQFYLLVPLLARLFSIRGKTRRRGLMIFVRQFDCRPVALFPRRRQAGALGAQLPSVLSGRVSAGRCLPL